MQLLNQEDGKSAMKAKIKQVVIDEDCERVAIAKYQLTEIRLGKINRVGTTEHVSTVLELLSSLIEKAKKLSETAREKKPNRSVLIDDREQLKKDIENILRRFKRKGGAFTELALNTEEVLDQAIKDIYRESRQLKAINRHIVEMTTPRWVADMIREIKSILSTNEPIKGGLRVTESSLVLLKKQKFKKNIKYIVLDAYGEEANYRYMFNREIRITEYDRKPNWTVHHFQKIINERRQMDARKISTAVRICR